MKQLFYFSFFAALISLFACGGNGEELSEEKDSLYIKPPTIEYGFVLDSFQVIRDTVQPDWTMSHMLTPYGVSQFNINLAADLAADSAVGLRYIKEGTPLLFLRQLVIHHRKRSTAFTQKIL